MKYNNNVFNLSLQQIQIFLKCVRLKNYSRVAAEYNFTPSMVSKTISSMESTLGICLQHTHRAAGYNADSSVLYSFQTGGEGIQRTFGKNRMGTQRYA